MYKLTILTFLALTLSFVKCQSVNADEYYDDEYYYDDQTTRAPAVPTTRRDIVRPQVTFSTRPPVDDTDYYYDDTTPAARPTAPPVRPTTRAPADDEYYDDTEEAATTVRLPVPPVPPVPAVPTPRAPVVVSVNVPVRPAATTVAPDDYYDDSYYEDNEQPTVPTVRVPAGVTVPNVRPVTQAPPPADYEYYEDDTEVNVAPAVTLRPVLQTLPPVPTARVTVDIVRPSTRPPVDTYDDEYYNYDTETVTLPVLPTVRVTVPPTVRVTVPPVPTIPTVRVTVPPVPTLPQLPTVRVTVPPVPTAPPLPTVPQLPTVRVTAPPVPTIPTVRVTVPALPTLPPVPTVPRVTLPVVTVPPVRVTVPDFIRPSTRPPVDDTYEYYDTEAPVPAATTRIPVQPPVVTTRPPVPAETTDYEYYDTDAPAPVPTTRTTRPAPTTVRTVTEIDYYDYTDEATTPARLPPTRPTTAARPIPVRTTTPPQAVATEYEYYETEDETTPRPPTTRRPSPTGTCSSRTPRFSETRFDDTSVVMGVFPDLRIDCDGEVSEWEFVPSHFNITRLYLAVFRRTLTPSSFYEFQLIGMNNQGPAAAAATRGRWNQYQVPASRRIQVQAGDMLGFFMVRYQNISDMIGQPQSLINLVRPTAEELRTFSFDAFTSDLSLTDVVQKYNGIVDFKYLGKYTAGFGLPGIRATVSPPQLEVETDAVVVGGGNVGVLPVVTPRPPRRRTPTPPPTPEQEDLAVPFRRCGRLPSNGDTTPGCIRETFTRYYFSSTLKTCVYYYFTTCVELAGRQPAPIRSGNSFDTAEQCLSICRALVDPLSEVIRPVEAEQRS